MSLSQGQVINNRYRIVKLLGQGGFGAVYRAWDININRPCAIKENLDTSPEAQHQFTREATTLANLSHPNLPRVTDHFSLVGQGQYLVMDFIEGEDLESMIQRRAASLPDQAIPRIIQIAGALSYLHSQNPPIIHRDIKPANIRIQSDGKAVLVDFGLVKIYNPHLKTTTGARAVTLGYSPPEQYGQGNTDARTDIYALGATLYTLLTGHEPQESVQRVGHDTLPPVHHINSQITPTIGQAVARAMALSPTQRYATADEFKDALETSTTQLWSTSPTLTVAPLVVQAPTPPQRQRAGLSIWMIGGAIIFVLATLALVLGLIFSPPRVVVQQVIVTNTPDSFETTLTLQAVSAEATASAEALMLAIAQSQQTATAQARQIASANADATQTAEALLLAIQHDLQTATAQAQSRTPRIYNFMVCSQSCNENGTNSSRTFPGGTTKLYARWKYENIPAGANYTRAWTMNGTPWVSYNCTWPGPETGMDQVTLTEPDGLHSGTWEITISVDGVTLLREQIVLDGRWEYWFPAGAFDTCYGKR